MSVVGFPCVHSKNNLTLVAMVISVAFFSGNTVCNSFMVCLLYNYCGQES